MSSILAKFENLTMFNTNLTFLELQNQPSGRRVATLRDMLRSQMQSNSEKLNLPFAFLRRQFNNGTVHMTNTIIISSLAAGNHTQSGGVPHKALVLNNTSILSVHDPSKNFTFDLGERMDTTNGSISLAENVVNGFNLFINGVGRINEINQVSNIGNVGSIGESNHISKLNSVGQLKGDVNHIGAIGHIERAQISEHLLKQASKKKLRKIGAKTRV